MIVSNAGPLVMSPRATSVAPSATITPPFWKPMKAMKSPIPQPIARRRLAGMALTMAVRKLVTVSRMKMRPSMNTAVNANCQL